jgi:ATP-dependent DNA ligase
MLPQPLNPPLPQRCSPAPDTLPRGDYTFEVKWDGFRAIVSTENGLLVRSRRGWDMSERLPAGDGDAVSGRVRVIRPPRPGSR